MHDPVTAGSAPSTTRIQTREGISGSFCEGIIDDRIELSTTDTEASAIAEFRMPQGFVLDSEQTLKPMPHTTGIPFHDADALFSFQQDVMISCLHNDMVELGRLLAAAVLCGELDQSSSFSTETMSMTTTTKFDSNGALHLFLKKIDLTFTTFLLGDADQFACAMHQLDEHVRCGDGGQYAPDSVLQLADDLFQYFTTQNETRLNLALETVNGLFQETVARAAEQLASVPAPGRVELVLDHELVETSCRELFHSWAELHRDQVEYMRATLEHTVDSLRGQYAASDAESDARPIPLTVRDFLFGLDHADRDLIRALALITLYIKGEYDGESDSGTVL